MTRRFLAYLGIFSLILWFEQREAKKQAEQELREKRERFYRSGIRRV